MNIMKEAKEDVHSRKRSCTGTKAQDVHVHVHVHLPNLFPFEFFRNSPSSTVPLRSTGPSRPGQQTHTHSLQLPT